MGKKENCGTAPRKGKPDGHIEVERLPRRPKNGAVYWLNSPTLTPEVTHGLFKFPAKFHAPIVRWALGTFGRRDSMVLDPFTGSGTVQVEALRRGISSVGLDIDPLSVLISRAKTTPIPPDELARLERSIAREVATLRERRGPIQEHPGGDISKRQYKAERAELELPRIQNLEHWFRRYVIVDLARLRKAIQQAETSHRGSVFLSACFAAIVRRVSNADPAPVSGLEVTSHQIGKNSSRAISVFGQFFDKVQSEAAQQRLLWEEVGRLGSRPRSVVLNGDARSLSKALRHKRRAFPLVVTSPPYCRAVEYSRRHRLELFWLGLVASSEEHIALGHKYLGRNYVRVGDWDWSGTFEVPALDQIIQEIESVDAHRARSVHHYFGNMRRALSEIRQSMKKTGTLVLVVGNSICAGVQLRTADYLAALADENFRLDYRFSYAIQNHYMQYGLWNGPGIKEEHVLVLKPR